MVKLMEGWPRVPSLLALCVRAVQRYGMTADVPPALLQMVRSRRLAPRRWKKPLPNLLPLQLKIGNDRA